jgi:hypothetical protein
MDLYDAVVGYHEDPPQRNDERHDLSREGLALGGTAFPLLFLFVMEVLHAMIRKADEWSLLNPFGVYEIPFRTSLYTDDIVLFVSPDARDLQIAKVIFDAFHGASGLACNV